LTQLLSSPTTASSPNVHSGSLTPQSILERLSPSNVIYSPSQQQAGRRRLKNSLSGTIKQGKNQRNLSAADLWSLADSTPGGAILLKAQLLEAARKLQQKEVNKYKQKKNQFFLMDLFFLRSLKITLIVVLFCKMVHLYCRIQMKI
jgi:hypothetical protein